MKRDEMKKADVTGAYDALPPDARRLYRLIEAAGRAIESADADTLGAVADMARFQSCHCPIGRILQYVVGGELAQRDYYWVFSDDDEYVGEEDDDDGDDGDGDDDEVIYEYDDDGDDDYVEQEYEDEDELWERIDNNA